VLGSEITVRQAGGLSVVDDATNPAPGLLVGQAVDNWVLSIRLRAAYEDVLITALPLYAEKINGGAWDQISRVSIWHGQDLLVQTIPSVTDEWPDELAPVHTSSPLVHLPQPLLVPQDDAGVTLQVKVDTTCFGLNCPGESGQGFRLYVPGQEIQARGASSMMQIMPAGEAWSGEFIVYRSIPFFATNIACGTWQVRSERLFTQNGKSLYATKVFADSAGDIGLGELTWVFTGSSNVSYTNIRLLSMPSGEVVGQGYLDYTSTAGGITNSDVCVDFEMPLTIPAGTEQTFLLTADVTIPPGESGNLRVSIKGDIDHYVGSFAQVAWREFNPAFIVWTDYLLAEPAEPLVWEANQWYSSYMIQNYAGSPLAYAVDWVMFDTSL
jgi:hypothetical protein